MFRYDDLSNLLLGSYCMKDYPQQKRKQLGTYGVHGYSAVPIRREVKMAKFDARLVSDKQRGRDLKC
jgi:hypothetical protein